jgi:hypothetical protein
MSTTRHTATVRFLLAVATVTTAVAGAVALTGGFVAHVGTLRISARGVDNPLTIAAVSWLLLALLERQRAAQLPRAIVPWLERHASNIAVVTAAACVGTSVRFGTFAAHATDPSAYVSHARLLLTGPLVRIEPLAQAFSAWHGGAWNFSPLGYRPGVGAGEIVPTYPLGLPAVLAVARALFGEIGTYFAVPLLAAALVLGCFALASRLHSRLGGIVAAALAATSPVLLFHALQPMSDVPAATWLVLAILAALADGWATGVAAGVCLGATRPNLAPLALLVGLCGLGWPLRRWTDWRWARAVPMTAGLSLVMVPFLVLQRRLYGSPTATGYGSLDQYFALSNIVPNVSDYARRLWTGETAAIGVVLCATVILITRRRAVSPASPIRPEGLRSTGLLAALAGALLLALYLPYGIFPDWAYLRFLLPALGVVFVFAGAVVAEAASRLPRGTQGVVVVVALVAICAVNVAGATRQQVFNLWRYESRYRSVGLYLKETLPRNAVVVTFQESGAIHYYTGAPIVRWDYLPVNLDEGIEALRARGLHPILVVEDWERPNLLARFPGSQLAKLDWTPRADIGETTHVWVLDPADRGRATGIVTDTFR